MIADFDGTLLRVGDAVKIVNATGHEFIDDGERVDIQFASHFLLGVYGEVAEFVARAGHVRVPVRVEFFKPVWLSSSPPIKQLLCDAGSLRAVGVVDLLASLLSHVAAGFEVGDRVEYVPRRPVPAHVTNERGERRRVRQWGTVCEEGDRPGRDPAEMGEDCYVWVRWDPSVMDSPKLGPPPPAPYPPRMIRRISPVELLAELDNE